MAASDPSETRPVLCTSGSRCQDSNSDSVQDRDRVDDGTVVSRPTLSLQERDTGVNDLKYELCVSCVGHDSMTRLVDGVLQDRSGHRNLQIGPGEVQVVEQNNNCHSGEIHQDGGSAQGAVEET